MAKKRLDAGVSAEDITNEEVAATEVANEQEATVEVTQSEPDADAYKGVGGAYVLVDGKRIPESEYIKNNS